jgi:hypothetical protein
MLMNDADEIAATLRAQRDLGVGLSVDDFGGEPGSQVVDPEGGRPVVALGAGGTRGSLSCFRTSADSRAAH